MRAVAPLLAALAGCGFTDEDSGEPVEYTAPGGGDADGGACAVAFTTEAASEDGDADRVESAPAVALDADGRAALAWIDAEAGGVESAVRVLAADGARYAPALPCDAVSDVSLAFAGDGALVLAVRCADLDAGAEVSSEIRLASLPFAESAVANDVAGAVADPRLSAGDQLLLAWSDGAIRVAASDDGGATFGASVEVATGVHPALAASGDATLLAWDDGSQVLVARSGDGGATFGSPVTIGAGTLPSIAADGDDVWVAREGGAAVIVARSVDGGASFADVGAPATTTSTTRTPAAVAIDEAGDALVFWGAEGQDGLWSFMLATSVLGQAFSVETVDGPFDAPCDEVGAPVAIAAAGDDIVLAWTGAADANCEVLEGIPCD